MSITSISSDPDNIYKKSSFHRRNDSRELDVFEAARYFSGYNEAQGMSTYTQKILKEDHHHRANNWRSGGRISLDMPIRNVLNQQQSYNTIDHHHKQVIKEKKYKQPSSPGGKLASFLNSLFSQSGFKKKKPKSSTQSVRDNIEEESPGGRRRRRSSISHFRSSISSTTMDSNSIYSSSSSGFRTPPIYNNNVDTPTKNYKEFRNIYSDQNQKKSGSAHAKTVALQTDHEKRNHKEFPDEKFQLKHKMINLSNGYSDKCALDKDQKDLTIGKFNNDGDDNGGDSDSSSDLFELQIYDLDCYSSSGLPVYETTNVDSIKRSGT